MDEGTLNIVQMRARFKRKQKIWKRSGDQNPIHLTPYDGNSLSSHPTQLNIAFGNIYPLLYKIR
jgi:hypothetical protein